MTLAVFEATVVHSRKIVGWDDPLSDEGAWIVPAESDAATAFVWISWYRKHGDSRTSSLTKQLRTVQSSREFLIGCFQPGQSTVRASLK